MIYNMMDVRIAWLLLCDWWKSTFYLTDKQLNEPLAPGYQLGWAK
jgi:hypothetical protein